jgi:hypothetical protein
LALIDLGTDQDHALARMRSPGMIARHRDLDRPGSATWLMLHRLGIPRFWGMRPLSLLLAFAPLIVFSVLASLLPSGLIGAAALAAAVIALMVGLTSRPIWPPKLLSSCSLILLALIAVLGFTLGRGDDSWPATWGGALIGLAAGQTRNLKMPEPAGP